MTFRPANRLSVRSLLLVLLTAGTAPAAWAQLSQSEPPDLGTYSIGEVQRSLRATGGDGTYAWQVIDGTLPEGVSLRTDGPPWFPSDVSAGLIGVATNPDTYHFTLRVTSGGEVADQAYTLKISPLVVTTFWDLPDAFVGQPYSQTLTANNAGPLTWTPTSPEPPGLTLLPSGEVSGLPTTAGFYTLSFSVTDGVDQIYRSVNIRVSDIEITTPGELPNATQNAAYSTTVSASGGGGSYTFTSGSLPNGLSLDPLSGEISGSANTGQGQYSFNLTASDGTTSTTKLMAIRVIGVPPSLPTIGSHFEDGTIGWPFSRNVWVSGGAKAPFTWTASGLPPGLAIRWGSGNTLSWITPGDVEISGTPTAVGDYGIQLTVTDADGKTASQTFPLHISPLLSHSPSLPNGVASLPYDGHLRFIGGTLPYTAVVVERRLPEGVTLDPSTLALTGTPVENGGFGFSVLVTDAASQTLHTDFFFSVAGSGGANVVINHDGNLGQITLNSYYSNQLSACCGSIAWSLEGGSLPPGLSFTDGLLSGLPTAEGTYTFLIRATDTLSGSFGQRQFTLVVTPLFITGNQTLANAFVNSSYNASLTAGGGTGPLTWTVAPRSFLPPGLMLSSFGSLSGTPTASGYYIFELTVTDSAAHVLTRSFDVSVYPEGTLPPISLHDGPDLGTFSIGEVQRSLSASGGNGSYVWQLVSGALPDGTALRTDGPPWFPADASAGVIGVATTPGDYEFTLRVTSGGESVERTYSMRISPLVVTVYWDLPDAFVGKAFSYTMTAANGAGPGPFSWTAMSGLPPGVFLSPSGEFQGTPTASGFFNVWLNVSDGLDTVGRNVSIQVFDIEITTDGTLPNATQNASYTTSIAASGGTASYTFTSDFLPNGLVLETSGTIHGTVNTGPGNYGFRVIVTDDDHVSYVKQMAIDVIGVPPVLPQIGIDFHDGTLGWPYTQNAWVSAGGTAPFTWTATGLPPGLSIRWGSGNTVSWVTPGNVEITGSPTALGTYNVTLTVTDASGKTASNTFPLRITELLDYSNYGGGTIFTPYSGKLRIIGGTLPYTAAEIDGRLPAGLTFDPATFVVSGTPVENGSFGLNLLVTDSATHALRTGYYLSIGGGTRTIGINHGGDLGYVTQGSFYSNEFSACCAPSYTWSLESGPATLPPGLSFSGSQLSGTPSTVGTYTFLVRAADGANPDNFGQRQFTMIVTPLSVPGNFTLADGFVNSTYTRSFTATGGTGPLTWTVVQNVLPPGLTLASDGTLSGIPTASGFFSFQLKVTDSAGHAYTRWFGVSIYAVGDYPALDIPIGPDLGVWSLGGIFVELRATGGVPPYHFEQAGTPIPGMRVQDGPPLPTFFTPGTTGGLIGVITTPGTYGTSIRVVDSMGNQFDRAVTITIPPLRNVSLFRPPKATLGQPYSFTFVPYGGSGSYYWTAENLPPGLTLDSSGQLHGTPTASGTFFPTLRLEDLSTSDYVWEGFALVVDPFAIAPGGVLPAGTVNTFYSQAFSAPGCGAPCTWTTQGGTPSGLSLNSSSGTLSGTPNGTFNSSFTVQASGPGGTVQKIFSLRIVSASPQPLAITNGAIGDRTVGDNTQVALFVSGGTAPYSWAVVAGALPPGVALVSPGEDFSANLAPGFSYLAGRAMVPGFYPFTLAVTDGTGTSITRAFSWHISSLLWMDFNLPLNPGTPLVYNTSYTHPLLVVGGTGTYTWTSLGNPMPPGLAVGSATGLVTGTPTNTGSFTSGIQAVDADGNSVFQNVSFFVSGPTSTLINFGLGANQGVFALGALQNRNLSLSGGSPPYTITALSPLPPGFEILTGNAVPNGFSPGSYVLSGIPLATGTFSFTLRAQDTAGNIGVRTFTIQVADLALFSPTTLADGSVSTSYSQTLLAWSSGTVTWSIFPGSSLPPGLNLSSDGLLSGIPTQAGDYSFTLGVTDASGATLSFFFTVRISNLAASDPAILPVAIAGVPYTYTFTATGNSGPVTWSAIGLPFGFTLSSTGTLSGTTTATASAFTFTVRATDGGPLLSRRFTLYARTPNPNQLTFPLISTALADTTVGQSVAFNLNPNSGVPPYTATVPSGSSLPAGLGLVAGDILPPNRNPGVILLAGAPRAAGLYTFDLVFTDSVGSQMRRTFTLRVTSLAILQQGPRTPIAGTPYAFQFTAVGGTPPYEFSILPAALGVDTLPPGFTLSADGLLSGTTTSTGSYSLFLRVQDALGKTVTRGMGFDVTNSAGVEVISGNPLDGPVGWGRSESLAAINLNGGSATYAWSLVSGALPPGTALMPDFNPGTTRLAGQPTVPGTYVYTLRATDSANAANFADHQFTFRVSPMQVVSPAVRFQAPDLPSGNVGSPYSVTLKVAGGTPPYTFSESPFSPLPSGVTLSLAGVLSGTPLEVGNFTITPIISDSAGHTMNGQSMNLVITPPGVPSPFTTVTVPRTLFDASLGVPYRLPLDAPYSTISRRGVAPYSWALSGGSLPPGIGLLAGANGVPNQLGGVPSTPGTYSFTLTASDASSQSSSVVVSLKVSRLALTPDVAPPGIVGAPYSVSLVPSGGTPPYTIQLDPTGDLPPGLSFTSGLLSGTPTYPGNFSLFVIATDSLGATVSKPYKITIDNAAGQSPALSLAPRPIQVYHEQGTPAPAPLIVSVDTTSGALPFTLAVSGLPFASLTATSGTTSTTVGLDIDVSSLGPGTYVGILGASAPGAANLIDSVPVTVTIAPPTPCSYTLNPSAGSQPAAGGGGSFDVAAGSTCSWAATTGTPWITITAGSGTGAGSVSYSVGLYGGTMPRTGTILVNGANYTVTQFGSDCSFAINPVDFLAPAAGGTAFIAVTASAPACPPWTATGLGATPSSGSGDGGVTVTIPPNPTASTVLHTATIAGQTLTVTQAGVGCDVSLSPYDTSAPAEGGAGSVTITTPADCPYDTVLGPSWITVTSPVGGSGIGSGTLVYSVEPNSTTESRSGSLTIGGQTFQLTQDGLACSVTIDTSALGAPYGPGGGTGFVGITTNGTNCSWTASSGAPWATMVPPSGTGNATISVHADSNASSVTPRSTDLTIAGQTVTILQSGTACTYSLQSASAAVPASGGSGSVGVVAPSVCSWTAVTNTPAWLTISSSGTAGSASVSFVAQPNTGAGPRSGTLTIAGLTYTVNQAGAPCSYTITTASPVTVSSDGFAAGTFDFTTAAAGCTPVPLSYVGWISASTASFDGSAGQVTYSVAANPTTATRVGTIQLGESTFEVRQTGGACGYSLNAYGALFDKHGGTSSVLGSPTGLGCTPATGTDQPSFILLDPLTGPVSNIFTQGYHVTPYDSLTIAIRRARITFGGQIFTVKQTSW
jgi:putative Ig domain-containing protein/all-beta uncharacterized protein